MSEIATDELAMPAEQTTDVESKTELGFWIYIMTDCVLFATLFATFAVLRGNTNGGPAGDQIFNLRYVLIETMVLLTSSFTCGLAILAAKARRKAQTLLWFGLTFALGLTFLIMELVEFTHLAHDGYGWSRSAFLSSYFTLVGTHGLHITIGLLWMVIMGVFVWRRGLSKTIVRRLTLLAIFWHFLDIVWIFIFTIVYLMGFIKL